MWHQARAKERREQKTWKFAQDFCFGQDIQISQIPIPTDCNPHLSTHTVVGVVVVVVGVVVVVVVGVVDVLLTGRKMVKVAVIGCVHGEVERLYDAVEHLTHPPHSLDIDLILCTGDFQAVREPHDLDSLACPPKYRELHTFYKYYTGSAAASIPLVFVGGNHEASNHLFELFFGGWVAPNMYYLGPGGVLSFNGLRIGGLSGIYKAHDFDKGHFEKPPYSSSSLRSAYHTRSIDIHQILAYSRPAGGEGEANPERPSPPRLDVFMSHDWPTDVVHSGDVDKLLRIKGFLAREIADGSFGSPPLAQVLTNLRPRFWFAAHMHVKFPALVAHPESDEVTKFLALDKIRPNGDFLQVLDIDPLAPEEGGIAVAENEENLLCYDPAWLALLQQTFPLMNFTASRTSLPEGGAPYPDQDAIQAMAARLVQANGSLAIPPDAFVRTQPFADGAIHTGSPQTEALFDLLGVSHSFFSPSDYILSDPGSSAAASGTASSSSSSAPVTASSPAPPSVPPSAITEPSGDSVINMSDDDDDDDDA